MRTSPLHIPRRDLVMGVADSLFLRVTVVDSDDPCAQGIDLTGGTGGPTLQLLVWADSYCRNAWSYGGWGYDYRNAWDYGAMPPWGAPPIWTGLGVVSDAIGAFDISFPTATMSSWSRRCAYALQLDWDGASGTSLLAEGHLHLARSIPRSVAPVIMLTDPSQPVLTDDSDDVILLDGSFK
jgi:hypothetical protein